MNEIPSGFCQCGCGQRTPIAKNRRSDLGWVKGQPIRFLPGHNARVLPVPIEPPNPSGLCQCGCGKPTRLARQNRVDFGWVKGEPLRYLPGHSARKPTEQRFWDQVDRRGPDECWEWLGTRVPHGYGTFSMGRKARLYAHRFSYEIANGPIPPGLEALHTCDHPACCNPAHLYAGTQKDNVQDMLNRNRANPPRGMRSGHTKLTDDNVRAIRQLHGQGASHVTLATQFGISDSAVGAIVNGQSWGHVT